MLNPWGEPPPDGSPYGGTAPSPTPRRASRGQPATVSIATKAASGYKPQNLLITGPRMRAGLAMTGPWFLSIVRDRRIAFREALKRTSLRFLGVGASRTPIPLSGFKTPLWPACHAVFAGPAPPECN
jgi:hypothetical protein